jgi:hypothetical protein
MAATKARVSDMLVTVKSREVQRAMFAEASGDRVASERHLLAAAHLEQVLADDYFQLGETWLAQRSLISAASCFWRADQVDKGRSILEKFMIDFPDRRELAEDVLAELINNCPMK